VNKLQRLGLTNLQRLFVQAYDGDVEQTAKRCCIEVADATAWSRQAWFFEALNERCKREADRAAKRRIADLAEAIAERSEVQAYWTAIMRGQRVPVIDPDTGLPELDDKGAPIYGPEPSMRDRTNASKHLADSLGMQAGCTTVIHEGGERPIVVKTQDLAERIKLVSRVTTTEEWLQ
jgi:hypothetical protein